MKKKPMRSMTALEFERCLKAWAGVADQVRKDAKKMPGPGWEPVKRRLRQEGRMLAAERRRRRSR